jgi:hypothetical protein
MISPFPSSIAPHRQQSRCGSNSLSAVTPSRSKSGASTSLDDRVMAALADAERALPFAKLRSRCRVRAATLCQGLAALTAAGRIVKMDDGYRLAD